MRDLASPAVVKVCLTTAIIAASSRKKRGAGCRSPQAWAAQAASNHRSSCGLVFFRASSFWRPGWEGASPAGFGLRLCTGLRTRPGCHPNPVSQRPWQFSQLHRRPLMASSIFYLPDHFRGVAEMIPAKGGCK